MRFTSLLKKVLRLSLLSGILLLLEVGAKLPLLAYGSDIEAIDSTISGKDFVLIIALDSKRDTAEVQEALLGFATELRQSDKLSVIVAGPHPRVALALNPIRESSIVVSQINRLTPQGNQNLFIAYSLALAQLNSASLESPRDELRPKILILIFEPPYRAAYFGINDLIALSTLASQRQVQTNILHLGHLADSKLQALASAGNGKTIVVSRLEELNLNSLGTRVRSERAEPLESYTSNTFTSPMESLDRSRFPIEDVLCQERPDAPNIHPLSYCDKFWATKTPRTFHPEQSQGL